MTRSIAAAETYESLRLLYAQSPELARISKRVSTVSSSGRDPFHGTVVPENIAVPDAPYGVSWRYGIDRAIGGLHDAPNPGEMLCGALAACADSSVRLIARQLGIALDDVGVEVTGELDVRGTLALDRSVRVGFQKLTTKVSLRAATATPAARIARLMAAVEALCVVLDTMRRGVPVEMTFECTPSGGEPGRKGSPG